MSISELTPRVGATAQRTRRVDDLDPERFAQLTGDRNPIHFNPALAAASQFGGVVVQGGVTSGLVNAVVAQDLPGPGSVFLHTDWSFTAPVRPGDVITARVEVSDVRADEPITHLRVAVTNQDDIVVLEGSAVVWRDPVVAQLWRPPAEAPEQAEARS